MGAKHRGQVQDKACPNKLKQRQAAKRKIENINMLKEFDYVSDYYTVKYVVH